MTSTRPLTATTIPVPSAGPTDTNPPDADDHTDIALNDHSAARPARYNRSIALGFAAATVVATLVVAGALMAMRSGPAPPPKTTAPAPAPRSACRPHPTTTGPGSANTDSAIPYTASAVGCLPGSTAAQSVAGPDSTQAWVCVAGGNIGQYLVLNLGRTMVITAVSITPGWVGTDPSGADQWQQHRVLTRVQWSFNDSPPTVVPQDTGSVHGDAVKPMPDPACWPPASSCSSKKPPAHPPTPHPPQCRADARWTVRRRPRAAAPPAEPPPTSSHPRAAQPARRPKPHRPRRQHLRGVVDQDLRPPTPVRGLTSMLTNTWRQRLDHTGHLFRRAGFVVGVGSCTVVAIATIWGWISTTPSTWPARRAARSTAPPSSAPTPKTV